MKTTNILLACILALQAALLAEMFTLRPQAVKWSYKASEFVNDNVADEERLRREERNGDAVFDEHLPGNFYNAFNNLTNSIWADTYEGWQVCAVVPELGTHDGFVRTEKLLVIYRKPER